MAKGVNKVILIGNLGQDPEVRYTAAGGAVANLSVATAESWTDKQSGQKQERTEWHKVVFFNKLGEVCEKYLHKGDKVYVEGSIHTRKWQDKEGKDRYTTEIVGSEMQMLGGKSDDANANPANSANGAPWRAEPKGGFAETSTEKPIDDVAPFDDDIPF